MEASKNPPPNVRFWQILRPTVIRYLEKEYVDRFFDTGELRLSTFEMFRRHADERCRDDQEGKVIINCITADGRETINVVAVGLASYVLCGTTVESAKMKRKWQRDSFIRIINTTGFAYEVSRAIPSFAGGVESFCIYQDGRTITKYNTPPIGDLHQLNKHPNRDAITEQYVMNAGGVDAHFLKLEKYRDEAEYRFVWWAEQQVSEPLTIHVPNATQYCQRAYIRPPDVPGQPFQKPVIDIEKESSILPKKKGIRMPWET